MALCHAGPLGSERARRQRDLRGVGLPDPRIRLNQILRDCGPAIRPQSGTVTAIICLASGVQSRVEVAVCRYRSRRPGNIYFTDE